MMSAAAILASMLAAVSPGAAETCDSLAAELGDTLDGTKMAMAPESALSSIYQRATEASARCSDSESLAYLRLRSAELGRGTAVGRQPESVQRAWRDLARDLAIKFPRSVRIVTVQARAAGTVAEAKRAVGLDASYAPAQVALAAALVSVDAQRARTVETWTSSSPTRETRARYPAPTRFWDWSTFKSGISRKRRSI